MNWTEIKIEIPSKDTEKATAIIQMTTSNGIYIEDYRDMEDEILKIAHVDLIDKSLKNKSRKLSIIHIYFNQDSSIEQSVSFLKINFEHQNIPYKITTSTSKLDDWGTKWKEFYHPIRIGKNVIICPEWEKYKLKKDDVKIVLNPGMAFGTGMHETTKMCIELLETYINTNYTVLDVGCGSGILAITSILLGSKLAVGIDIDPLAVKVANENAMLNNLDNKSFNFICGNLTEKISGKYDIICANIVADVIMELSNTIKRFMHEKSLLICSGIIKQRKNEVIKKLESKNLSVCIIKQKNDWIALCCKIR